jgi:hypothetical protein
MLKSMRPAAFTRDPGLAGDLPQVHMEVRPVQREVLTVEF